MSVAEAVKEPVSYLDMSDEELSAIDPSTIGNSSPAPEAAEDTDQEDTETAAVPEQEVAADEDTKDDAEDAQESPAPQAAADTPVKAEEKSAEAVQEAIDYKAQYERLLVPFKANGRDIAVNNIDDAISLMQMGANYNKKMAALKPNLKLMKLLENNGLLSEERIGFLIDLEKKNPDAISKLVKDSGLDPLDLDAEKASGYKPNTYTVDDREMELDAVLDEIQGTPAYNRTLDIVSTKWDGPSKQVIASTPQLLKVINGHVQSGIYDTIVKEVERERMFGRLDGLSDIEAYRKVGDSIQERGGFNSVGHPEKTAPKLALVTPKPSKVDEDKLRDKKRAAGSAKPAGSSAPLKDFNPLAMSDEEFSKQVNSKFL
jgi:hypothetical protein